MYVCFHSRAAIENYFNLEIIPNIQEFTKTFNLIASVLYTFMQRNKLCLIRVKSRPSGYFFYCVILQNVIPKLPKNCRKYDVIDSRFIQKFLTPCTKF